MRRKVTLAGELKEKFGEVFYVNADSHQSILKCINANRPEFKQYLLESIDKNVGFTIDMAGESVAEEDLLTPLKEGDVTITAIPAGSKSGMGKILAAIALAVLVIYTAGAALLAATPGAATGFGATMSAGMGATFSGMQMMGMGLAVNLALAGINSCWPQIQQWIQTAPQIICTKDLLKQLLKEIQFRYYMESLEYPVGP